MKDFGLGQGGDNLQVGTCGADCQAVATVKERPILFSGPMIRAILDGPKTQTRRLKGLDAVNKNPDLWRYEGYHEESGHCFAELARSDSEGSQGLVLRCPYGKPGDRLWVKETFTTFPTRTADEQIDLEIKLGKFERGEVSDIVEAAMSLPDSTGPLKAIYRANYGDWANDPDCDLGPWTPSVYMPRAYSRITREVTEIRVQRISEISRLDAAAEGLCYLSDERHAGRYEDKHNGLYIIQYSQFPEENFARLWDSINGKKPGCSWAENPFVWCLSFKAVQP